MSNIFNSNNNSSVSLSTNRSSNLSIEEMRLNRIRRHQLARRQRQIRIRLILAAFVVLLTVVCSCFIGGVISNASEADSTPAVKCYKSVVVAYNQDLDDLVNEYMDYAHYKSKEDLRGEITRSNHLTSVDLEAGSYIVIPYFVEKTEM